MSRRQARTYQIDVWSEVYAAVHGLTTKFGAWRCVAQVKAGRQASALRQAERTYPGRKIRARLITGQFSDRGTP